MALVSIMSVHTRKRCQGPFTAALRREVLGLTLKKGGSHNVSSLAEGQYQPGRNFREQFSHLAGKRTGSMAIGRDAKQGWHRKSSVEVVRLPQDWKWMKP